MLGVSLRARYDTIQVMLGVSLAGQVTHNSSIFNHFSAIFWHACEHRFSWQLKTIKQNISKALFTYNKAFRE